MANTVFVPELLEAGITAKLGAAIKLYNIVDVQPLGAEQAGDTVTFLSTEYIGDAEEVAAGEAIPNGDFTDGNKKVPVKKYAKGLIFTDEDFKAGVNLQDRAETQITKSVASGVEKALYTALGTVKPAMTHTEVKTALDVDVISDALVKFGEDLDGEKYLLINPASLAALRKDKNFVVVTSEKVESPGQIFGCTVVVSSRVGAKEAFIIKPSALAVRLREAVKIKVQEEAADDTVLINGRTHAAVALADETGAIKITLA